RCGQDLELGRVEAFRSRADRLDRALEVRLLPTDADPLAPATDVRREVGADREARVREQRLGRPRRRRLPVRADDVDRRIPPLRIAELGEQRADPLEPEALCGPRAQALNPS